MRVLFGCCSVRSFAWVRVPSLAQPAGADQGLYAYVGQRILAGEPAVSRRLGPEASRDPLHLRRDVRPLAR